MSETAMEILVADVDLIPILKSITSNRIVKYPEFEDRT